VRSISLFPVLLDGTTSDHICLQQIGSEISFCLGGLKPELDPSPGRMNAVRAAIRYGVATERLLADEAITTPNENLATKSPARHIAGPASAAEHGTPNARERSSKGTCYPNPQRDHVEHGKKRGLKRTVLWPFRHKE